MVNVSDVIIVFCFILLNKYKRFDKNDVDNKEEMN